MPIFETLAGWKMEGTWRVQLSRRKLAGVSRSNLRTDDGLDVGYLLACKVFSLRDDSSVGVFPTGMSE